MSQSIPNTAQIDVQVTLTNAESLPEAERRALIQEFRGNLQIILGGAERMRARLTAEYQHNQHADRDPSKDALLSDDLLRAFKVAEYTTWMGRDRPLGAHFSVLFEPVPVN